MLPSFLKAQLPVNLHLTSEFLGFVCPHRDCIVFSWGWFIFPLFIRVTQLLNLQQPAKKTALPGACCGFFFRRPILHISAWYHIGTAVVFVSLGQQCCPGGWSSPLQEKTAGPEPWCYQCFLQTLTGTASRQKLLLLHQLFDA